MIHLNISGKKHSKITILLIFLAIFIAVLTIGIFLYHHDNNSVSSNTAIIKPQVCHLENPLGIDERIPTFSWQMSSSRNGAFQSAYQITVAESKTDLDGGNYVWDSGKITSPDSVGICYEGKPLKAKQRYYWSVTVWDESDSPIVLTEVPWFEMGLLGTGMSKASWISAQAPSFPEVRSEDLSYNIHYDIQLDATSAGFVFGAAEGRYGDLYICEISHKEERTLFRLQQMSGGAFVSEEELDITHCRHDSDNVFSVNLSVKESILDVSVNDVFVNTFAIKETPIGSIGYYKSRSTSYAYLDNISATTPSGAVLYSEDFADAETIFSPYYVYVSDGQLRISSGMLLTKGYDSPAPLFRREFDIKDKPIESARLYTTALGSFSASINGKRISNDYLSPGKLAFNKQLSYVTYDVTDYLVSGQTNALGYILLHGWYDRAVGYPEIWNPWGEKNALLGQLEIRYQDGTSDLIVTDSSFRCFTDGPIRSDDIYQGEFYDANYEQQGFDLAGFDESGWTTATENAIDPFYTALPLVAKKNEPIVCTRELTPVSVSEPVENVFVYDFGQNFAGTCRIHIKGNQGQVITLRYAEALNTDTLSNRDDLPGTIWTENLLTADATDYYVLSGNPDGETFEPEFTFHGYRYLQITGLEEAIPVDDITGIVLSSDLDQTGAFTCSNELLNQFYQNTINSMQSNFLDNPTDCPQRDERHGWAGDAQIFSLTASYHANTYSFYEKYLEELRLLQSEGGSFSDMAPRNFGTNPDGTGGAASNNCWGDAPVVITWNLYMQYGDKAILRENYEALCKWVDVLVLTSEDYIRSYGGYGDHLSLESTPNDLSDTAWCAHSAHLLSKIAYALDKPEDAVYYESVYNSFKQAWQSRYVLPDGMTICHTQTSYALGLAFSLFPEELTDEATTHLLSLLENSGYQVKTGFSGISQLLPALSRYGHTDTAYQLLLQESYPSLLYPVKQGATTTWELWQGHHENGDGTYRLEGSFNHYAYGAPASFIYTDILGIKSSEAKPGYQHILLEPRPHELLSFAKGSYESIYGTIYSSYEKTEAGYCYRFTIPANTNATLTLPLLPEGQSYLADDKPIDANPNITCNGILGSQISFELSSGSYCFTTSD